MVQNLLIAAVSGIAGAAVMTCFIYLFKVTDLDLDIPYLLGSRFVAIGNRAKVYGTGLILHLLSGAFWGALYVYFLTAMAVTPNWPAGILFGFAHGIFVGAMIGILSENHPQIGENKPLSDPGMFGSRWGAGIPYVLLAVHVIYGVTTLFIYHRWIGT